MLHNRPFKKITVTGQTVNKEYVLAVHNPKDIDYSGVYALKLKAAGKLFRVDFSIAGDNEISHSDVNIGILNIVDNNSGIGTTQTAFNNNFTLKVVQNAAGLNLIVIRMLAVIMAGNFEMTISNTVPTGLDWSDYGKYIGKDYSTIAGYPFANETVKSPVKILGGINAPEVTTTAATSVTSSGMILNANLTTLGSEASVNVAFDWRLVGAGSWTRTSLVAKTTIGTFSATLSGLASNTTYEYRAVVIGQSNPGNDAIGGVLSQLTVAINIDADSGVNITGTSGGSALNTTNVPSVTNGSVNNGTGLMTATADNCVSQTVEIAQQVGQSDFQLLKTTFALAPYQMTIDPATTSSSIVVTDPESGNITAGSKFWLESAGVMKLVQAGTVVESSSSTFATRASPFSSGATWSATYDASTGIFYLVNGSLQKIGTSNDGKNWNLLTSTGTGLSGLNFIKSNNNGTLIACSTTNISRSTDNGVSFTDVGTISAGGSQQPIAFNNSNWYVVDYQSIKKSTNDGVSFSSIYTWSGRVIHCIASGASGVLLALSGSSGFNETIVSTDNGTTWASGGNIGGYATGAITSIVYSNSTFFAAGQPGLFKSTDNGATWASVSVPGATGTLISFATDGAGKLIAGYLSGLGKIFISTDNGANWIQGTISINPGTLTIGNGVCVATANSSYSVASNEIQYTCTSLTSLFGGAITTTPTLVYKAGQSFESSITATSGTTSYTADTLYSVSRSGNILTLTFNQRAATGRYARSKATVNKGDVISRYAIDLWN